MTVKNYIELSDEELLTRMKCEDKIAFDFIYDRYWKDIFYTVYRKLKQKEVAEELTQNLFLNLWERRSQVEILNLKGWLFSAIRFSIINHYKSQMVHEKFVQYTQQSSLTMHHDTEQSTLHNDLLKAIEKGVALLPDKTQQVFKLSRFENRSIKEISSALNISEKAVEYHITQSMKRMRFFLKDYLTYAIVFLAVYGS